MSDALWRQVPVGPDAARWTTRSAERNIIVVIHSLIYAQRLFDVIDLLEGDLRLQVVFCRAPHALGDNVDEFFQRRGIRPLSWEQSTYQRFDLALAAGYRRVDELHAPLVVFPHGANHIKLARVRTYGGAAATRHVGGLGSQYLIRDGMVVPTRIVLAHDDELTQLAHQCPEALPVAAVLGDPCRDRIVASLGHRAAYRRALGVRDHERLVVITSTWRDNSLFGGALEAVPRLLAELPPDHRALMLIHPNAWAAHGTWQMRSWLKDCRRLGLGIVPPEADWRAPLIASDFIVGDHGSVTLYGTLVGVPIILGAAPAADINPDSPAARLARTAPMLSAARPIGEQLEYAAREYVPEEYATIAAGISSEPGRFARNARRLLYNELRLSQPATTPVLEPLPLPDTVWDAGRPVAG
jgi:hypothetical protein